MSPTTLCAGEAAVALVPVQCVGHLSSTSSTTLTDEASTLRLAPHVHTDTTYTAVVLDKTGGLFRLAVRLGLLWLVCY